MKTVYFVRHGESEGNAGSYFQDIDSPLTAKGKAQARFIAERCEKLPIEILVSSPAQRTKETALVISGALRSPIEWSEFFVERMRPASIVGKRKDDAAALAIDRSWFDASKAELAGGETVEELISRTDDALGFLRAKGEEHILVVTHGFFLRTLIGRIVLGNDLNAMTLRKLIAGMRTDNTGLTVVTDDSWSKEMPWRVRVFNDHAHLG
jgi:probable phosphoglycerate mutase